MEKVYFNGHFIPKEQVRISPDDRGFLFADGIYEVVRWYQGSFFDMPGHVSRLKRSLGELGIIWKDAGVFPSIAAELVSLNNLQKLPVMVYLQVTRGAARRTHYYPVPGVPPTAYAFAFEFIPDEISWEKGVNVMLKNDIRWSRCDIKSVSLLPNTMSFQEAYAAGLKECIFVRNGHITEGSHSNIFFVMNNIIYTHPESNMILSGITRKNVLRIAVKSGFRMIERAINKHDISLVSEAFLTNTSSEITPVTELGGIRIGTGLPGPVTRLLQQIFRSETSALKG